MILSVTKRHRNFAEVSDFYITQVIENSVNFI